MASVQTIQNYESPTLSALLVQAPEYREQVYPSGTLQGIPSRVKLSHPPMDVQTLLESPAFLEGIEVLITGWGAPPMDFICANASQIKLVLYGGGAASGVICPEIWDRGILFSSAYGANARPVAEFTVATAILALKKAWMSAAAARQGSATARSHEIRGAYGSTIGLISCGAIGREVVRISSAYDLRIMIWDPYLSDDQIREIGGSPVGMEEVFREADVVSVHTPALPETYRMIREKHFLMMKPHAAFINTARGSVVDEEGMLRAAKGRADLQFVLDVTDPEPPVAGSLIYDSPNIFYTPHIAGAIGPECRRLGNYMMDELHRYVAGEPLQYLVTKDLARTSSHRPGFLADRAGKS